MSGLRRGRASLRGALPCGFAVLALLALLGNAFSPATALFARGRRLAQTRARARPDSTPAQPSQFEIAMLETIKGVRAGTLPDPAQRKADGAPGTLLDALLGPLDLPKDEVTALHRRQLAAAWRKMGANVPFSVGPTLSAFNSSFFRYASVVEPPATDWRQTSYVTPVQVQFNCASCWAVASADTVAMASAIARRVAPQPAGVQQFCDCSPYECCQGGWPEDAYSWMVSLGNITTNAYYNYFAWDRNCTMDTSRPYPVAGNVTGYERVPSNNERALMKAVSMQPVLVYISAASKDFIGYSSTAPGTDGFKVYNGNCTSEVNHAVVIVGYNTTGTQRYWIVKNSWPYWGWGDNGYMYLAMTGDGAGKCGIQSVSPLYPVNFPTAPKVLTVSSGSNVPTYRPTATPSGGEPCANIINPCGAGSCYSRNNIARCTCPSPFVENIGLPTSKCVHMSPCSTLQINPCGSGTCMDVGDGGYICGCPSGYVVGSLANGSPTCLPATQIAQRIPYSVRPGDTTQSIISSFSMVASDFCALNPVVDCTQTSKVLPPGMVVLVSTPTSVCTQQYAVRGGETCAQISYAIDSRGSQFITALNPDTYFSTSTTTTTLGSSFATSTSTTSNTLDGRMALSYSLSSYDLVGEPTLMYDFPQLDSVSSTYSLSSLVSNNPGLDCVNRGLFASQLVCINSIPTSNAISSSAVVCGSAYTTAVGDTCQSVASAFNLTSTSLASLNPGLNCAANGGFLQTGFQICIKAATNVATINCTQKYRIKHGDSCAQVWNAANLSQSQFMYINPGLQCQDPYLYVGKEVCVDSPVLVSMQDPNFETWTVQANDTLGYIQGQYSTKCQSYSIAVSRIASYNNITNWTTWTSVGRVGTTLIIPCVPKVGANCGCAPSLTVCGGDFLNYNSYCQATCDFASPITTGACTACQNACAGRYGQAPSPTSACASGYMCPYPVWPPDSTDASKVYSCPGCLCKYRQATCLNACAYGSNLGYVNNATCYNNCFACSRVPCGGPATSSSQGYDPCWGTCASTYSIGVSTGAACYVTGKTSPPPCATICSYWNNWWQTSSNNTWGWNP